MLLPGLSLKPTNGFAVDEIETGNDHELRSTFQVCHVTCIISESTLANGVKWYDFYSYN